MATTQDLRDARSLMIRRVAERVVALQDRGTSLERIKHELFGEPDTRAWSRLITLDPGLTAAELLRLADLLDTSSTWLLTGRDPLPTAPGTTTTTTAQTGEHR